jgi:hypothetical protein
MCARRKAEKHGLTSGWIGHHDVPMSFTLHQWRMMSSPQGRETLGRAGSARTPLISRRAAAVISTLANHPEPEMRRFGPARRCLRPSRILD